MTDKNTSEARLTRFHLEYPPFSRDDIRILTEEEFWEELPPNHHYEDVEIGPGGDYPTYEALAEAIASENEKRRW